MARFRGERSELISLLYNGVLNKYLSVVTKTEVAKISFWWELKTLSFVVPDFLYCYFQAENHSLMTLIMLKI